MKKLLLIAVMGLSLFGNDIVVKNSKKTVEATMDKLQNIVNKKGFTVFAVINHQLGADKVRMKMAPSEEIIFGNPKMGTIIMQENMQAGLDLPIRILVYQDADQKTKIAYRDGTWLQNEHNITKIKLINKMNFVLDNITTEAGR